MKISFNENFLLKLDDFCQKYLMRRSLQRILYWDYFKEREYWYKEYKNKAKINSAVFGLKKSGYIETRKIGKRISLKITPKGVARILKIKLKALKAGQTKWDGRWRVVIFDIPEQERKKRNFFRKILHSFDFQKLQGSVWISPHDNLKEIRGFAREFYLLPYVKFMLVEEVDDEENLIKQFFGAKKKLMKVFS